MVTHGSPAQQSALVVHDWLACWHAVALHTSCPLAFVTHGVPLQHSVAIAHAFPAAMQPAPLSPTPVYALHRGTPNASRTHARNFGRCPPQQSARALETPHV
jgi:hypothetical protein